MSKDLKQIVRNLGLCSIASEREATEVAIKELEVRLGQPLPLDYREFIRHFGKTAANGLVFPDPDHPDRPGGGVEVFYGLQPDGGYDLTSEWEGMKDRLPPGMMPIADSPGGMICLAIEGDQRGAICWCADEFYRSGSAGELYLIARSFAEFLDELSLVSS